VSSSGSDAVADPAAALHEGGGHDAPARLHAALHAQVPAAHPLGDLGVHGPLEDVARALEVAGRRADVAPIALADVRVQALPDEAREHVALDRGRLARVEQVEHHALQHVHAGADVVRVDLVGRGLLDEGGDLPVRRGAHQPVGRGIGHRRQRQRRPRARRAVPCHLRGDVDVGQHVAVEHEEPLVQQRLGVLRGAARAERPRLLDVAKPQPVRRAVAEDVADPGGEVPAAHDDVVDAVAPQPVEHEGDERPVDQRHHRLRHRRGEGSQAGPFAAGQDQRLHPVSRSR